MSAEPDQPSGDQPAGSGGGRFSTLIGSLTAATSTDRAARADQAAQGDQADQAEQADQPAQADPANQTVPPGQAAYAGQSTQADRTDQADHWQTTPTRPTFTARESEPPTAVTPEPAAVPAQAYTPEPGSSWDRVRRTPAADVPPPDAVSPVPDMPARPDADPPALPDADMPALADPALPDEAGTRALPRPAAAVDEPLLSDAAGLRARWQRVQLGFVDDPQEAVGDAADLIEQTAQALVGALRQRQRQLRVMWERGPDAAADGEPAARASDTEHLRLMMQRYRALFNELCRP